MDLSSAPLFWACCPLVFQFPDESDLIINRKSLKEIHDSCTLLSQGEMWGFQMQTAAVDSSWEQRKKQCSLLAHPLFSTFCFRRYYLLSSHLPILVLLLLAPVLRVKWVFLSGTVCVIYCSKFRLNFILFQMFHFKWLPYLSIPYGTDHK